MSRKEYGICYVEDKEDHYQIGFVAKDDNLEFIKGIIFMEFVVNEGNNLSVDDEILNAEAMKGASRLKSPISGKVMEVNREIEENPENLADEPESWLIKVEK